MTTIVKSNVKEKKIKCIFSWKTSKNNSFINKRIVTTVYNNNIKKLKIQNNCTDI